MRLSAFVFLALPLTTTTASACCIVDLEFDGITALALDGQTLDFAESTDKRMPIAGNIYEISEYWSANGLTVQSYTLGVEANFGASLDLTRPAALTSLSFDTGALRGVPELEGTDYQMGPRGGSLQVTAIVPQAGGYRIRGEFTGQICPQDDTNLPCQTLQGRFAFDSDTLPASAITGNLVNSDS